MAVNNKKATGKPVASPPSGMPIQATGNVPAIQNYYAENKPQYTYYNTPLSQLPVDEGYRAFLKTQAENINAPLAEWNRNRIANPFVHTPPPSSVSKPEEPGPISNIFGALRGVDNLATDVVAGIQKDGFNWRDLTHPFEQIGTGIGEAVNKARTAGGFSDYFNLVNPASTTNALMQGLQYAGENTADIGQVLSNAGWKERTPTEGEKWYQNFAERKKGQFDLGDIVEFANPLSPLNYTGAGETISLLKAAKRALPQAVKDVAKEYGVNQVKGLATAEDVAQAVTRKNYLEQVKDIKAQGLTGEALQKARAEAKGTARSQGAKSTMRINNLVNESANKARNTLLSLDIMGTNINIPLLRKPKWMQKQLVEAGTSAIDPVKVLALKAGLTEQGLKNLLENRYGVSSADKLSLSAFDDLTKFLTEASKEALPKEADDLFANLDELRYYEQKLGKPQTSFDDVLNNIKTSDVRNESARISGLLDNIKSEVSRKLGTEEVDPTKFARDTLTKLGIPEDVADVLDEAIFHSVNLGKKVKDYRKSGTVQNTMATHIANAIDYLTKNNPTSATYDAATYAKVADHVKNQIIPYLRQDVSKYFGDASGSIPESKIFTPFSMRTKKFPTSEAYTPEQALKDLEARKPSTPQTIDDYVLKKSEMPEWTGKQAVGKFVEDYAHSGFKNPVTQKFLKNNRITKWFDTRSLATDDNLVNYMATHISDAFNKQFGNLKRLERPLRMIRSLAEKMRPDDLDNVSYIIEKRFKGMDEAQSAVEAERIMTERPDIASMVRQVETLLKELGQEQKAVGVLAALRKDYYPHVRKLTQEKIDEILARFNNDQYKTVLERMTGVSARPGHANARNSYATLAELDDELSRLREEYGNAADEATRATIKNKLDALDELFERDPINALSSYIYQSVRSIAFKELYDKFKDYGMIIKEAKPDYIKLNPSTVKSLGLSAEKDADLFLHKDVAEGMAKVESIFAHDQKWLKHTYDYMEVINSVFKQLALNVLPKNIMANIVGNSFNSMLAGATPSDVAKAAKILADIFRNKVSAKNQRLVREAYDLGILGQGHTADYIMHDLYNKKDGAMLLYRALKATQEYLQEGLINGKPAKLFVTKFPSMWTQGLRRGADVVDDIFRLGVYLSVKDKTGNSKVAANTVRKYLFNYHELTKADKALRVVVPFWSWTKNNIPLMLYKIITKPSPFVIVDKIRQATLGTEEERSKYPSYVQEQYGGFPVVGAIRSSLPYADIGTAYELMQGNLKSAAQMTTPIIRGAVEGAFNEQLSSGAPISRGLQTGESAKFSDFFPYYLTQLGGAPGTIAWRTYQENRPDKQNVRPASEQITNEVVAGLFGAPYKPKVAPFSQEYIDMILGNKGGQ